MIGSVSGLGLATAVLAATTAANSLQALASTASGAFAFSLGNSTYYSPASVVANGSFDFGSRVSAEFLPLTVLKTNEVSITSNTLAEIVTSYAALDDVWSEDFLGGAIALVTPPDATMDPSVSTWATKSGAKVVLTNAAINDSGLGTVSVVAIPESWDLSPGPYTITHSDGTGSVREAYAVHRDNYEAFLFGVTPVPGSSAYEAVEVFIPSFQDAWIPVPSRLKWLEDERPLAGLRIGLKDIYDLEGVRTGGGSRSYAEVYGPREATAVSVQKLLDMGAVVVVSPSLYVFGP